MINSERERAVYFQKSDLKQRWLQPLQEVVENIPGA